MSGQARRQTLAPRRTASREAESLQCRATSTSDQKAPAASTLRHRPCRAARAPMPNRMRPARRPIRAQDVHGNGSSSVAQPSSSSASSAPLIPRGSSCSADRLQPRLGGRLGLIELLAAARATRRGGSRPAPARSLRATTSAIASVDRQQSGERRSQPRRQAQYSRDLAIAVERPVSDSRRLSRPRRRPRP